MSEVKPMSHVKEVDVEEEKLFFDENQPEMVEGEEETVSSASAPEILAKMCVAVEAIHQLSDIYAITKLEGVSKPDVDGIRALVKRMSTEGFEAPKKAVASLEQYASMFTPTRSTLNVTISQEAVMATIINTLKTWFEKLMELFAKLMRWISDFKKRDVVVATRYGKIVRAVDQARTLFQELLVKNRLGNRKDALLEKFDAIAQSIIDDPKILASRVYAAAFGSVYYQKEIININNEARTELGTMEKLVGTIIEYVNYNGDDYRALMPIANIREIGKLATRCNELSTVYPDRSSIPDFPDKNFWKNSHLLKDRFVAPLDDLLKAYRNSSDALRKLKQLSRNYSQETIDAIGESVQLINTSLEGMRRITDTMFEYSQAQYLAASCVLNYYGKCAQVVSEDYKIHGFNDAIREWQRRFDKVIDDFKRGYAM
ncbi:TPA: hypothetical protein ACGJ7A_005740 [Pseudomonas aeruginosa]